MTYLSLFNGMSCGYIAAAELGLPITKYYSSEIDKHAIKAAQAIHPDTIQLGDITKWQEWDIDWRTVDIVLAGSPCQGFSFAGKQLAFDDPRSKLFFVFVDILRHIQTLNPKVLFLLENVRMKAEHENVISRVLGVSPIVINSALVSAQNRIRLYWFGQSRERLFFNDYLCYNCIKKENEIKRILGEAQSKGENEVLGEAQKRQKNVYNLPNGIPKNREEGDDKDLLKNLPRNKQEEFGQEKEQRNQEKISERISEKKQRKATSISENIQTNSERKGIVGKNGNQPIEDNCQKNANAHTSSVWSKEEANKRRIDYNSKYGKEVCCVQCGEKLDYRPHHSFISWGNKRIKEFTSPMSELQFNEARQNNGRVFDTYKIGVKGIYTLFGETISDIPQPADRGILLRDILETKVPEKYYLSDKMLNYFNNRAANFNQEKQDISAIDCNGKEDKDKAGALQARYSKGVEQYGSATFIKINTDGKPKPNQDKANCFTAGGNSGGLHSDMDLICEQNKEKLIMQLNPSTESGGGQPYQQNRVYSTDGIVPALSAELSGRNNILEINEANKTGVAKIEPGECFDFENPNSKTRRGRLMQHKSNCLMAKETDFMHYTTSHRIRRLTPRECGRLQTVPEPILDTLLSSGISDTQLYRLFGNGWTVDVIKHILSHINT